MDPFKRYKRRPEETTQLLDQQLLMIQLEYPFNGRIRCVCMDSQGMMHDVWRDKLYSEIVDNGAKQFFCETRIDALNKTVEYNNQIIKEAKINNEVINKVKAEFQKILGELSVPNPE